MTDTNHSRRRAVAWAATQQWAIEPHALQQLLEVAGREHVPDLEAVAARQGEQLARNLDLGLRGDVAVLPLIGPLFRYANLFTAISGATSIEQAALSLQAALDDPRVRSIVLNIDSPGGAVAGISDFAKAVRAASSRKPVIAFVGGTGASAAYWIASAAPWVVVSDTALVGGIGVVLSVLVDQDARVVEIVSAQSPNKRPDLRTDAGRQVLQQVVDELAGVFVNTVAKHRSTSATRVLSAFGGGSVLVGRAAVAAGMAEEVGTLEAILSSFAGGGHGPAYAQLMRIKAEQETVHDAGEPLADRGSWDRAIARVSGKVKS